MIWKKEKISVQTPFYGNKNIYNMLYKSYPIDEAKRFINEIKHLIIGFTLDTVLVYGFNGDGTSGDCLLNEHALDKYEWEQTFIFIINQQQFEVDISANKHYKLALNITQIDKIIKTEKLKEKDISGRWGNNSKNEYLDISHLFKNSILNQKIIDIELTPGKDNDEDYEYMENIIIKFENGKSLLIEEGCDNPAIRIV